MRHSCFNASWTECCLMHWNVSLKRKHSSCLETHNWCMCMWLSMPILVISKKQSKFKHVSWGKLKCVEQYGSFKTTQFTTSCCFVRYLSEHIRLSEKVAKKCWLWKVVSYTWLLNWYSWKSRKRKELKWVWNWTCRKGWKVKSAQ